MTEIEFEGLLQSAFKDSGNVPDEINQRLKKKLYKKLKYKRILKSIPASMAACLVIGIAVASVMLNGGKDNTEDIMHKPIAVNEKIRTTIIPENREMGAVEESIAFDNALIGSIDNDIEKLMSITDKVKEYMIANPYYEFYDGFEGLSGNERCYYEESGELVVIFDEGTIAPKEHGEIFINVGIIK